MIKVNNTAISSPTDFSVKIKDLEKRDRNANGDEIIEVIATKREIELSYSYLSNNDLSTVLSAISSTFFTVEYPDPATGALRSGTFSKGDRSAGGIDYINDVMRWKDIRFTLIER